jgi:formylmethanofuran dehydrogenase subunit E
MRGPGHKPREIKHGKIINRVLHLQHITEGFKMEDMKHSVFDFLDEIAPVDPSVTCATCGSWTAAEDVRGRFCPLCYWWTLP